MGTLIAVLSFPLGLVRWLWDGLQFGRHSLLVIRERARFERLAILEVDQLRSLESLSSRLISVYLDRVSLEIGESSSLEPFVSIQIRMFNGTVFTLKPGESSFGLSYNGNRLSMAHTLTRRPMTLPPGYIDTFQFRQPVQELTAKDLRSIRDNHFRVKWDVEFSVDLWVVEPEITYTLADNNMTSEEIPFLR